MKKKISLIGALALFASALAFAPAASSAEQYSIPAAPKNVTASVSSAGIMVKWVSPANTQPEVTTYVVYGGQGSCPIYVSPTNNNTLNSAYNTNGIADMWINFRGYNDGYTQFRNFNVGVPGDYV